MKIRNGFVSNSSSSSFIITLPKDKNIRLSEMEDYLGGYSDELTEDQKDILSYFLWRTIRDKNKTEEELKNNRSDDYYELRDNEWITDKSILDEDKSNYYIEIDDNEPGDYLGYDDAYDLRRIDKLFKDPSKVIEV